MPPKFSLQPVLDFRHSRVEALEIDLSQLLALQQRGVSLMESLHARQARICEELKQQQAGEMDLTVVNRLRSDLRAIENQIQKQRMALAEMEQRIRHKRSEVIGAKQEEETLVILKNKERERYLAEQLYQENRQQDDIYISQAFRRTASSRT